jgi:DNA invertase Pin-like site-specific DNA recombinase
MNKITPDHLTRSAYVYVRQSTPDQLANNPESRRRQYALADRARALGWENVIVIDDDLGRSGGGTARPGFERLLAAMCTGSAGAVLAIEASRPARNASSACGRDRCRAGDRRSGAHGRRYAGRDGTPRRCAR